jgi:hypothetical protein
MTIPQFLYVMVDKKTGKLFKGSNRELPFYKSPDNISRAMRNIAKSVDIDNIRIEQYELRRSAIISE